jgi:hypothetical protein
MRTRTVAALFTSELSDGSSVPLATDLAHRPAHLLKPPFGPYCTHCTRRIENNMSSLRNHVIIDLAIQVTSYSLSLKE